MGLFCFKGLCNFVRRRYRPTRPPGGGCDEGDPTKVESYSLGARGARGGRNAGTRGAEESEHAHLTTKAHNEPHARYNTGDLLGTGRAIGSSWEREPTNPKRAVTTNVRGSERHLFLSQSEQSAFRVCRLGCLRGAARSLYQKLKFCANQAQPTLATPGGARKKRPSKYGLYLNFRVAHTILDTLATLRIF